MYEGEVNVTNTSLHSFMRLAEALKVKGLTDAPNVSKVTFMQEHI